MHKLIEYICDELEELERKAEKDGKLSMSEIQYGDTLAHFKKNLLKADEMYDEGEGYSSRYPYYMGNSYRYEGEGSYARGRKRDAMGRYSRNRGYSMKSSDMVDELRELMHDAPDEQTRMEFQRFISKIEQM